MTDDQSRTRGLSCVVQGAYMLRQTNQSYRRLRPSTSFGSDGLEFGGKVETLTGSAYTTLSYQLLGLHASVLGCDLTLECGRPSNRAHNPHQTHTPQFRLLHPPTSQGCASPPSTNAFCLGQPTATAVLSAVAVEASDANMIVWSHEAMGAGSEEPALPMTTSRALSAALLS